MSVYELIELLEFVRTDIGRKDYIEAMNKMDRVVEEVKASNIECPSCDERFWWEGEV